MYIIGVTGGIACGKTIVSHEIGKYGANVISADNLAHELSEPGRPIYDAYVKHFGKEILTDEGKLNRRAIACIVFNDPLEKKWIDELTHPMLFNHFRDKLVKNQAAGVPITVLDVPLLFEAGWDVLADEVWTIWLSRAKQFRRLMYRNHISYLEAAARINAQMDLMEKRDRADVAINNSKTRYELKKKVERLMLVKFPYLTREGSIEQEEEERKAALEAARAQQFNQVQQNSSDEEIEDFKVNTPTPVGM